MKCHCNTLFLHENGGDDQHTFDVGRFDHNSNCENVDTACAAIETLELGENLKCRLTYCRENDDGECFLSDGATEKCGSLETRFSTVSEVTDKETKLGKANYLLNETYYGEALGKRLCTLKFDDPLELMDGCMGTYELVLTESDTVNVVLYERTTDEQSFKHLHCYKNIVPMALGAAVGGVCGVTMIVGAVSIYLYDRYLKKKEVKDHEEQVKVNNTFTSNPLAADKPDETTHLNPSNTTFDRSGQIDAQQFDATIGNDPNTTTSESFWVPQDKPVPTMRQSMRQ